MFSSDLNVCDIKSTELKLLAMTNSDTKECNETFVGTELFQNDTEFYHRANTFGIIYSLIFPSDGRVQRIEEGK
jgi:hypothetical protein